MNLKIAFLATAAAGGFLLVAACGGGDSRSTTDSNSSSTPSIGGSDTVALLPVPMPSMPPEPPRSTSRRSCQPLTQPTTIVGGDLFVADQGPIGLTLLSDGGL